jgi:hypothetical protein
LRAKNHGKGATCEVSAEFSPGGREESSFLLALHCSLLHARVARSRLGLCRSRGLRVLAIALCVETIASIEREREGAGAHASAPMQEKETAIYRDITSI